MASRVSLNPIRLKVGSVRRLDPFFDRVLQAKFDRIDVEAVGDLVEDRLRGEGPIGAPGARYAVTFGVFTTTSKPSILTLGMS
jgi:hypothetical protein